MRDDLVPGEVTRIIRQAWGKSQIKMEGQLVRDEWGAGEVRK
jgi:hypothetical protein